MSSRSATRAVARWVLLAVGAVVTLAAGLVGFVVGGEVGVHVSSALFDSANRSTWYVAGALFVGAAVFVFAGSVIARLSRALSGNGLSATSGESKNAGAPLGSSSDVGDPHR